SGNLYAGGDFTTAGGATVNRVAKWNGSSWTALGSGMNSTVRALTMDASGTLYAGGYFTAAGGASADYIAQWDGTSWATLGSGMDSYVGSLTTDAGGNLYAGGWFTTAGGAPANHIAQWDGTSWAALGSGMDGYVGALATHVSAAVSAAGQENAAPTQADAVVAADATLDLYAGGWFTTAGDNPSAYIGQWTGNVTLAVTLGYFAAVRDGDRVNVHWQTAAETGVAGFMLYGEMDGSVTRLNAQLIPSVAVDSLTPQDYSYQAVTPATRFYLDEHGVDGSITRHGPFEAGETYGAYTLPGNQEASPALYLPFVAGE
ncbi:MAG: hypothetical protein KDD92_18910, partial [Caldilineaceae bacterium]|nr:hypothetical protein [Caldilineaceae bacterium]